MKDGPTKKQLQARVAKLEAELAKYRKGDSVRAEGEHWYELREYFDAEQIRRIPAPWREPTFLMGMLEHTFVIEVPQSVDQHEIHKFLGLLKDNGMAPALAIRAGVRFLRLASCTPEMEQRLDEVKASKRHGEEEQQERVPTLQPAEGRSEDPEVPAVPGADGGGAPAGEPDPQRDAPRE